MSLDNIQLPASVIQDLYKKSLVLSNVKEDKKSQMLSTAVSFNILGNNQQKILILVSDSETLYLPDEQLNFLMGILTACKLTMQDVAILNIEKNKDISYTNLTATLKSEKIILFGVETSRISLPLQFPTYQMQAYNNQVYLSAPLLTVLQNDKAEKTKLWLCLKQLFSIQ
ncbi:MAG TPA: hypothetical protein VK705_07880 [Ferruginibacter sp.]|jgi:hypothetical protein|nr:hypothetical protein [Ferruginibacter sp.]